VTAGRQRQPFEVAIQVLFDLPLRLGHEPRLTRSPARAATRPIAKARVPQRLAGWCATERFDA